MKQDDTTTRKTAPAPQVLTREQLKSVTGAHVQSGNQAGYNHSGKSGSGANS